MQTGIAPVTNVLELIQMNVITGLCLVAVVFFLWLLPWYVAKRRQHHNVLPILLITLFFGWTVIGWFGALIWACTSPPPARA